MKIPVTINGKRRKWPFYKYMIYQNTKRIEELNERINRIENVLKSAGENSADGVKND